MGSGRSVRWPGTSPCWEIRLPLVEVRGRVTLGDEPIAATFWFGGAYGERRIRFEPDAEGRFEGLLPEEGLWPVHLVSGAESLRLPLKPVEVKVSQGKSFAEVEIRVPTPVWPARSWNGCRGRVRAARPGAGLALVEAKGRRAQQRRGRGLGRGGEGSASPSSAPE